MNAPARAGSATWNLNPTSSDWYTITNWTPATVPNAPGDVATFSVSNQTTVTVTGVEIALDSMVFKPGANAFTFTFPEILPLTGITFSGSGIVNNSGVLQTFATDMGTITFTQNATAGELITFVNAYGLDFHNNASAGDCTITPRVANNGRIIDFWDNSTADHSTITMNPGILSLVQFMNNSTAGNATITHQGSDYYVYAAATLFRNTSSAGNGYFIAEGALPSHQQLDGNPGSVAFFDTTTAANGTFIANGGQAAQTAGGVIDLEDSSTAENGTFYANGATIRGAFGGRAEFRDDSQASAATLIATASSGNTEDSGGGILFFDTSTGDTARVELFGNGFLDLREHDAPKLTIGSLSGDGLVFLGAANLSVGSNNLSTTFSGLIEENSEGTSGSLTKIGTGSFTLAGANTFTGGTTIEGGKLVVNNRDGSGTGSGAVQVNSGTLAGRGTIAGVVAIGTGSGAGAVLAPGRRGGKPGNSLTIQSALTFNSDATFNCGLNTKGAIADQVAAKGVTINDAQFSLVDRGRFALTPGTVFKVIDNTAATPVAGTFANLPEGSVVVTHANTFQASYEGGDGNDLTLTVVP